MQPSIYQLRMKITKHADAVGSSISAHTYIFSSDVRVSCLGWRVVRLEILSTEWHAIHGDADGGRSAGEVLRRVDHGLYGGLGQGLLQSGRLLRRLRGLPCNQGWCLQDAPVSQRACCLSATGALQISKTTTRQSPEGAGEAQFAYKSSNSKMWSCKILLHILSRPF